MATAVAWRFQIDAFTSDRTVVVPDQHYSLTSIKEMARLIAARLPARFDLVGWSMGGYIAFELYPLVRERIRKLVLICTTARPESKEDLRRRAEQLQSVETEGLRKVYARQVSCNLVDPSLVDSAFKEDVVAETVRLGERTLRNQMRAITARSDSRPSLRETTCDTLVIGGIHDTITPVECSEEIASLLPHATLHTVNWAGHCAPWERPREVNTVMRNFLD